MFAHSALDRSRREIRLVRFTPATLADPQAAIALELRHISLDAGFAYAAMSYVWGDPSNPIEVDINNEAFPIGRNLHAGLERFREQGVHSWLWIDAICIQQSDTDEKSWQVDQMRDVYRLAEHVQIWLGPATADSDAAMDFLARFGPRALACGALDLNAMGYRDPHKQEIFDYIDAHKAGNPASTDSQLGCFILDLLNEEGMLTPPPHNNLQAGIQDLLQRDYWIRVWIMQEVALAKEGTLFCGAKSVSLDAFDATFTAVWYTLSAGVIPRYPEYDSFGAVLWAWTMVFRVKAFIARRQHRAGAPIPLAQIVVEYLDAPGRPHYAATDPRDIVYSLLGLTAEEERLGMRPDYARSFVDVFAEFTRAVLERGGGGTTPFSLFCVAPREEGSSTLPSWVPDWREVGRHGLGVNPHDVLTTTQPAAWMEPWEVWKRGDVGSGRVLRHPGCRVDTITEVMAPAEWTHATEWDVLNAKIKDVDAWLRSIIEFAGLPSKGRGLRGGLEDVSKEEEEGDEEKENGGDEDEEEAEEEEEDENEEDEDEEDEGGEDEDGEDEDGEGEDGEDEQGDEEDRVWRTILRDRRDGIRLENVRFGRLMNKEERNLISTIFRREQIDPDDLTQDQADFVTNRRGPLPQLCADPGSLTLAEQVAFLAREWPQRVGNENRHTTLFKTASGFIGAGHESVRPGDLVTILYGEKRPIVLRPRGQSADAGFTLQGHAYVDGIMYGEFLCTPPKRGQKFKKLKGTGINNVGEYWVTRDQNGYKRTSEDGEGPDPGKRVAGPKCEVFEIH